MMEIKWPDAEAERIAAWADEGSPGFTDGIKQSLTAAGGPTDTKAVANFAVLFLLEHGAICRCQDCGGFYNPHTGHEHP